MIKDFLNERVVFVAPETKVTDAARKMADENVGAVLVCEDKKPCGVVTDRDIVVRCIAKNVDVSDCTVDQILSEPVECVQDTDGIYDIVQKMQASHIRRMPVVNKDGDAVGLISFGDLIQIISKELSALAEAATPVAEEGRDLEIEAA